MPKTNREIVRRFTFVKFAITCQDVVGVRLFRIVPYQCLVEDIDFSFHRRVCPICSFNPKLYKNTKTNSIYILSSNIKVKQGFVNAFPSFVAVIFLSLFVKRIKVFKYIL